MNILIDSDILIEVSRGRNEKVIEDWTRLGASKAGLMCSPVTIAEIWHGALAPEHNVLERLFSALLCASIDSSIGRLAGDYLRRFHRSHGVELGDALIGATAAIHGATLWTLNRKHYPMREIRFWDHALR